MKFPNLVKDADRTSVLTFGASGTSRDQAAYSIDNLRIGAAGRSIKLEDEKVTGDAHDRRDGILGQDVLTLARLCPRLWRNTPEVAGEIVALRKVPPSAGFELARGSESASGSALPHRGRKMMRETLGLDREGVVNLLTASCVRPQGFRKDFVSSTP